MLVSEEVVKTFLICVTVVLTTLAIVKHRRRSMDDPLRWVCRHCNAVHHYIPKKCARCAKQNDDKKKEGSKWPTKSNPTTDNPITEEW
jgi:hypothetical protein